MRNKFFLFIIAAFMATSSVWAQCPSQNIDSIPKPRYITDFRLEGTTLFFTDNFRTDLGLKRYYSIEVFEQCNFECPFQFAANKYYYGSRDLHYMLYVTYLETGFWENDRGGLKFADISKLFSACYEKGLTEVTFFVKPFYWYKNEVTGHSYPESYYGKNDQNQHLINYYKILVLR